MNFEMENEFPRDYAGEIALECNRLEGALKAGLEDYEHSYRMLGKSKWYSLGLENNDDDHHKDEANKKNILMRMIEKVIEFLKMIGSKIVEWYKRCKAAIMKFFGKDKVDPQAVAQRLELLTDGLSPEDGKALASKFSHEVKTYLAEVFHPAYCDNFISLCSDYKLIKDKCDSVDKFATNYGFFGDFKQKYDGLKEAAKTNKIYESIDDKLAKVLSSGKMPSGIMGSIAIFEELNAYHAHHSDKLERLLKKIPSDELSAVEGNDIDLKRRRMVDMVSTVIKINSDIVLKTNHYMQAISMLMTYITQYRLKKVVIIKM